MIIQTANLVDIVRASISFKHPSDLLNGIKLLQSSIESSEVKQNEKKSDLRLVKIARIKNK